MRGPHSEDTKQKIADANRGRTWKHSEDAKRRISEGNTGKVRTPDMRKQLSESLLRSGIRSLPRGPHSEERKQRISASLVGQPAPRGAGFHNFSGGSVGDAFAAVLCPIGYEREIVVQYGTSPQERHKLDFGHRQAKVNIELDGPYHDSTDDNVRDQRLRKLGWRIIRIRHD